MVWFLTPTTGDGNTGTFTAIAPTGAFHVAHVARKACTLLQLRELLADMIVAQVLDFAYCDGGLLWPTH